MWAELKWKINLKYKLLQAHDKNEGFLYIFIRNYIHSVQKETKEIYGTNATMFIWFETRMRHKEGTWIFDW